MRKRDCANLLSAIFFPIGVVPAVNWLMGFSNNSDAGFGGPNEPGLVEVPTRNVADE